tara:strand:- start:265 stop:543 length:279 start_codon:yes stop_codon:yes gene_type:complete
MLAAVITLCVLLVVFIYTTINLLRKNEKLSDQILELDDVIINVYRRFDDALEQMRAADQKGGFESDDEIGQVFSQIKGIIEDIKQDLESENE